MAGLLEGQITPTAFREIPVHYETEAPAATAVMPLPEVRVGSISIRLAVHTDNIMRILQFLYGRANIQELLIAGRRIPDQATRERLMQHPVYKFFMQGRTARVGEELSFLLPKNMRFTPSEIGQLAQTPVSPASLRKEVGYDVVYYQASDLLALYQSGQIQANDLLPIFGGSNEVQLGSNILNQDGLQRIATDMHEQIQAQEEEFAALGNKPIPPSLLTQYQVFNNFPDTSTFNKLYPPLPLPKTNSNKFEDPLVNIKSIKNQGKW